MPRIKPCKDNKGNLYYRRRQPPPRLHIPRKWAPVSLNPRMRLGDQALFNPVADYVVRTKRILNQCQQLLTLCRRWQYQDKFLWDYKETLISWRTYWQRQKHSVYRHLTMYIRQIITNMKDYQISPDFTKRWGYCLVESEDLAFEIDRAQLHKQSGIELQQSARRLAAAIHKFLSFVPSIEEQKLEKRLQDERLTARK